MWCLDIPIKCNQSNVTHIKTKQKTQIKSNIVTKKLTKHYQKVTQQNTITKLAYNYNKNV